MVESKEPTNTPRAYLCQIACVASSIGGTAVNELPDFMELPWWFAEEIKAARGW